jgi:hypothetical protein
MSLRYRAGRKGSACSVFVHPSPKKIQVELTATAQRLVSLNGHVEFSTEMEQGMAMPGVGDSMRITLTEPPLYLRVMERKYDFTTSPATVTLVLGASG